MEDPGGYDPLADGLKVRSLSIRVEGSGSGRMSRKSGHRFSGKHALGLDP